MDFILSLLSNRNVVFGILFVVLFLGTGIYIKILKNELSHSQDENNILSLKLSVSETSVKSLQNAINDQNSAIERLKKSASDREKLYRIEIEKATSKAGTLKKQADEILKKILPQNITKCDAANELVNSQINEGK